MRTFHLPLTDELHEALREQAMADQRPATELVREALVAWMEARRRQRLAAEIERFASAEAGGALDLDPELESAGLEHLLTEQSP